MRISVLSGSISDYDVSQALLLDGIVVLQTLRPNAEAIHKRMLKILDINVENEESKSLVYLLLESYDGDWIPCLIYTDKEELEPTQKFVQGACEQWIRNGSQDKFVANIAT